MQPGTPGRYSGAASLWRAAIPMSRSGRLLGSVERIWSVMPDRTRVSRLGVHRLARIDVALWCDVGERIAVGLQYRVDAEVHHAAHDHITIPGRDLAAVAAAVKHVRRGHRRAAPHERVEDHVAGVGKG